MLSLLTTIEWLLPYISKFNCVNVIVYCSCFYKFSCIYFTVKQILSRCCSDGEELAERGETCSDLNPPVDVVPPEMMSSCLFSSEICCAAKVRIEDCKSGVIAAKDGSDCHGNVTDFYTSCCESCKIGMVIGASENTCEPQVFQFGTPFDDAYTFCCRDAKIEGVFYMPEGDRKMNKFNSRILPFVYGTLSFRQHLRQVRSVVLSNLC